jgi:hypothetical protein
MHTEFRSVAEYLHAIEKRARSWKPVSGEDYTMWYGVGLYRLWQEEWSWEKPFEAAIRMSLEGKARHMRRFGRERIAPAEAHLFDLFGIDWTSEPIASESKSA